MSMSDGRTPITGGQLNREWEIVTVEEVRRRLSLTDLSPGNLPLPKGCSDSRILDEAKLQQIVQV
jgi:hypothetical protein